MNTVPRWVIGPLSQMQETDWFGALGEELGTARLGRGGLWVSGLEVKGHQHSCGLKPKRGHANPLVNVSVPGTCIQKCQGPELLILSVPSSGSGSWYVPDPGLIKIS